MSPRDEENLHPCVRLILISAIPFLLSCCLIPFGIDITAHPFTQIITYLLFVWKLNNELFN